MRHADLSLKPSAPAQWVFDRMLCLKPVSLVTKIWLRLLDTLRRQLVLRNDPLIQFNLMGVSMLAPLSHELPFIQSLQPHYSTNVARVASGLAERYPDLSCIDVGANIGDSVIMLRKQRKFPILCVEPNDRYFAILQHNTRGLADLELEKCLLSDGGAFAGRMLSERGTARLIKDSAAAQTLRTKTLTE